MTATSADDVWALGYWGDQTGYTNLALHWDGSSWTPVQMDSPPYADMSSAPADSSDDAWAVGYSQSGPYSAKTFIEHWDGSAWSRSQ